MRIVDILAMSSPHRRWVVEKITSSFFRDYVHDFIDKKVLEIGCGAGFSTEVIRKYFSPKSITAIDNDSTMIRLANRNTRAQHISFRTVDATKLPFKDNSFDAVFDYCALHHMPTPLWKTCIRELHRVLSPGGKIFIYENYYESFTTICGKMYRLLLSHPYDAMYRKRELLDFIRLAKFKVIKKIILRHYMAIIPYILLVIEKK